MEYIAVTWHREQYFNKETKALYMKKIDALVKKISESWKEITFNLWGANGVDNWFWIACMNHNIAINLYLPFWETLNKKEPFWEFCIKNRQQMKSWNEEKKEELYDIYKYAKLYSVWLWYHWRDKAMVDDCTKYVYTVFFWNKKSWTGYTIDYAIKLWKEVYNLHNL